MRDGGLWGTRPLGWCFTTPGGFVGCALLWWHGGVARQPLFLGKVLSIRWKGNVPWVESLGKPRERLWNSLPKCL
jgi:hypothetical protein